MIIRKLPKDVELGCLLETGIDANHAWLVRIRQEFQTRVPLFQMADPTTHEVT